MPNIASGREIPALNRLRKRDDLMARPQTSPAARLRALKDAKDKLPPLKRGETLSMRPMAEMLRVSTKALTAWCDDIPGFEESGVFVRGGNGVEYAFKPRRTIDWLIKHFEKEVQSAAAKSRRTRKIVAGNALDAAPEDYSLDDMRKMVQLSQTIQADRERQGQLIDAAKARDAFREYHSRLQSAMLKSAQEQDPQGRWTAEIREPFENAIRSVLLDMERAGRTCLERLNGGTA